MALVQVHIDLKAEKASAQSVEKICRNAQPDRFRNDSSFAVRLVVGVQLAPAGTLGGRIAAALYSKFVEESIEFLLLLRGSGSYLDS